MLKLPKMPNVPNVPTFAKVTQMPIQSNPAAQIFERYCAQVAHGVQHFPRPVSAQPKAPPHEEITSATVRVELADVPACVRCDLASTRKRVVLARTFEARPFMALADFPEVHDEEALALFSQDTAASALLVRLFAKLGIDDQVHRSFALKCVPRKSVPNGALEACKPNMLAEITAVDPDVIFCFGVRSFLSLSSLASISLPSMSHSQASNKADSHSGQGGLIECGECPAVHIAGRDRRVFVFPAARDLAAFPEWRSGVWDVLLAFRKVR